MMIAIEESINQLIGRPVTTSWKGFIEYGNQLVSIDSNEQLVGVD